MMIVFTSSSSLVLEARKKQVMAMQRRYFGRAYRQITSITVENINLLHDVGKLWYNNNIDCEPEQKIGSKQTGLISS